MPKSPGHHDGLQALRGLLALLVFVQHVSFLSTALVPHPVTPLYVVGTLSVYVFFALSGFLMTGKAGDAPVKFVTDRARRIIPAFWVSLIAATMLITPGPFHLSMFPWDIALLLPTHKANWLPTPHWSLYFECFFYLLVFVVARFRVSWARPAIVLWGVISLVLYAFAIEPHQYAPPDLFNMAFPIYAIFFAAGVLAGWDYQPRREHAWRYGALAVLCFVPGLVTIPKMFHMPGLGNLVWSIEAVGACCAIRAALCWQPRTWLSGFLKLAGDASYGFYLIHIVVMMHVVEWLRRTYTPHSYVATALLVAVLAFPPAFLFGMADAWLQTAFKSVQRWLRAAKPVVPVVEDAAA